MYSGLNFQLSVLLKGKYLLCLLHLQFLVVNFHVGNLGVSDCHVKFQVREANISSNGFRNGREETVTLYGMQEFSQQLCGFLGDICC